MGRLAFQKEIRRSLFLGVDIEDMIVKSFRLKIKTSEALGEESGGEETGCISPSPDVLAYLSFSYYG